jgi:hypothetical protein
VAGVGEAESKEPAGGEGEGGGPQDRAAAQEAVEADAEEGPGGAAEGGHPGHTAVHGHQVALVVPADLGAEELGDHGGAADAVGPGADQEAEGERVEQE